MDADTETTPLVSNTPFHHLHYLNVENVNLENPENSLDKVAKFFADVCGYLKADTNFYDSHGNTSSIIHIMDCLSLLTEKNYIALKPLRTEHERLFSYAEKTVVCTVVFSPMTTFRNETLQPAININCEFEKERSGFIGYNFKIDGKPYTLCNSLNGLKGMLEQHYDVRLEYFTVQEIETIANFIDEASKIPNPPQGYPLFHLNYLHQKLNSRTANKNHFHQSPAVARLEEFTPRVTQEKHNLIEFTPGSDIKNRFIMPKEEKKEGQGVCCNIV